MISSRIGLDDLRRRLEEQSLGQFLAQLRVDLLVRLDRLRSRDRDHFAAELVLDRLLALSGHGADHQDLALPHLRRRLEQGHGEVDLLPVAAGEMDDRLARAPLLLNQNPLVDAERGVVDGQRKVRGQRPGGHARPDLDAENPLGAGLLDLLDRLVAAGQRLAADEFDVGKAGREFADVGVVFGPRGRRVELRLRPRPGAAGIEHVDLHLGIRWQRRQQVRGGRPAAAGHQQARRPPGRCRRQESAAIQSAVASSAGTAPDTITLTIRSDHVGETRHGILLAQRSRRCPLHNDKQPLLLSATVDHGHWRRTRPFGWSSFARLEGASARVSHSDHSQSLAKRFH